ncbi:MAG: diaminopimelate epimerase [Candidatus Omnitrophica bacterium]|jgi:diaminopimelate epimerase|nr:diaminopimelate epimerase [Candidatus Omnitrophota bacterium]
MKKIKFTKMVASGNDFVVIRKLSPIPAAGGSAFGGSYQLSAFAKSICNRKYGVGADGLLLLEKSKKADIRMRIFNADGSEAEMCGNGARCAALYFSFQLSALSSQLKIETKAGIIASEVNKDNVRIKLTDPKHLKLNFPIKVRGRLIRVNFVNTGVPHAVIFTEGLEKINIKELGRQIRNHKKFAPVGTNVDFIEVLGNNSIRVRTYERGVEDETLACGTGSVASALITARSLGLAGEKINVHTQSKEILKIYFEKSGNSFKNVWLEGKAKKVYTGVYDV